MLKSFNRCVCGAFLWHVRNGAESVTQNWRQIAWNDFISFIYDADARVALYRLLENEVALSPHIDFSFFCDKT